MIFSHDRGGAEARRGRTRDGSAQEAELTAAEHAEQDGEREKRSAQARLPSMAENVKERTFETRAAGVTSYLLKPHGM